MGSVNVTRRSLVITAAGVAAGAAAAACGPLGRQAPADGARPTYDGVVFQHLAKGTGVADMRNYQRVIDELFVPKHLGVRVEIIPDGGVGYWEKVLSLLAAGTPPDAAQQDEYFMAHHIVRNELLELTPYQVKDRSFNPKEMYEGAWRAGHLRNKLYGLSA